VIWSSDHRSATFRVQHITSSSVQSNVPEDGKIVARNMSS